jgi:hypothetical protein
VFGAKTGQKIVLIQYKKDFVPLILSDLVHRASHITLIHDSVENATPKLLRSIVLARGCLTAGGRAKQNTRTTMS